MLKTLKQLFQLLTPSQRSRFYRLQILVMLMAFGELLGIASIGPFMALVADMQLLETNATLKQIYQVTGLTNPQDFLFFTGLGVLVMLTLASVVSIFTTWRLSIFSFSVGTEIADRRYAIDPTKMQNELGWAPEETFETGLRKNVQWYLDNEQWWQNVLNGSYQLERLGVD